MGFANKMAATVSTSHLDQGSSLSMPGHGIGSRDVGDLDQVRGERVGSRWHNSMQSGTDKVCTRTHHDFVAHVTILIVNHNYFTL